MPAPHAGGWGRPLRRSKLALVDLAGSERAKQTGTTGEPPAGRRARSAPSLQHECVTLDARFPSRPRPFAPTLPRRPRRALPGGRLYQQRPPRARQRHHSPQRGAAGRRRRQGRRREAVRRGRAAAHPLPGFKAHAAAAGRIGGQQRDSFHRLCFAGGRVARAHRRHAQVRAGVPTLHLPVALVLPPSRQLAPCLALPASFRRAPAFRCAPINSFRCTLRQTLIPDSRLPPSARTPRPLTNCHAPADPNSHTHTLPTQT